MSLCGRYHFFLKKKANARVHIVQIVKKIKEIYFHIVHFPTSTF